MSERSDTQALSTADLVRQPQETAEMSVPGSVSTAPTDQLIDTRPQGDRPQPVTPESTPLFTPDDAEDFRGRWTDIQAGFVDEPRQAVEQADSLVAEVIQRLASVF